MPYMLDYIRRFDLPTVTMNDGLPRYFVDGKNADAALARPHGSRGDEVLAAFRADAPDLIDEVIAVDDFAWTEQPWIGASFGGPPVGGAWMIEEWTRPEDRIHFAGDWATMKSG